MGKQFSNTDLFVYAMGLSVCSVCVPEDMPIGKIEELANVQEPTGIDSNWKLSEDKTFTTGEENPCKCDKYHKEKRLHYLLKC